MTTKNILELSERRDMIDAAQDELTTEELANVQGGWFHLGNIVGSVVEVVLPEALQAVLPES